MYLGFPSFCTRSSFKQIYCSDVFNWGHAEQEKRHEALKSDNRCQATIDVKQIFENRSQAAGQEPLENRFQARQTMSSDNRCQAKTPDAGLKKPFWF
jgi:hypothetical protein